MNNKGNTIRNCEITNFDEGIYIDNSDNNTVYSCTVDSNAFDGIYLTTGSDNNNILYSSIQSNGWYLGSAGVYITTNSSSNILFANDLTNNPEVGLKIDHSSIRNVVELNSFSNDKRAVVIDSSGQNSVISNMMENNSFYGILSSRATGDDYSRNLLHNNTYGIRLWSSGSNNRITENKINNHLNYGIYIYNTDSGEVRHNLIDNTSFGIYFNHAYNWKAIADTIENCKNYGIYMESDTDVRIDSNYICSNKEDIRDLNSSSGDNNNCQFVYNWADDGEAEGCTHSCLLCGDVIQDSNINVTDVVYLVNYLFKGGPAPLCPPSPYLDCADANGDETVSVADVIYLINYLFKGGPRPVC
ncbi:MAG: right-handed parallel beta-helix repeat-containing protein [candidate division Zixibacteria bacterium]|nr:right-handed parallel beta-helix repeat-containing protein [candidate division Zixibacteria bacterium]